MAAMPPFAKEKFFGSIRNFVRENGITDLSVVKFLDLESGKVEGEVPLTPQQNQG
jgi:hypothetical protein